MTNTWDDLSRPGPKEPVQESPEAKRFYELCASVFTVGVGAELMTMMRARTIETRSQRFAPEAVIREDEAIRRFVAWLEMARDRGNEALARGKKPG